MVSYEFQGNVFRLTLEGEYSTADIRHAIDAALASPDYPDDAIFLFDASRSTALGSRSAGELRIALHGRHHTHRLLRSRPQRHQQSQQRGHGEPIR